MRIAYGITLTGKRARWPFQYPQDDSPLPPRWEALTWYFGTVLVGLVGAILMVAYG